MGMVKLLLRNKKSTEKVKFFSPVNKAQHYNIKPNGFSNLACEGSMSSILINHNTIKKPIPNQKRKTTSISNIRSGYVNWAKKLCHVSNNITNGIPNLTNKEDYLRIEPCQDSPILSYFSWLLTLGLLLVDSFFTMIASVLRFVCSNTPSPHSSSVHTAYYWWGITSS